MPISYRIDPLRQWVMTTAWGVLTDADVLAHKAALANDPQFTPAMSELSDISGIDRLEVTPAGVRAMVAHDERHPRRSGHRLALVVPKPDVFGMARMYQMMSGPDPNIGVFKDVTEAATWLAGTGQTGRP